jgi:hypothetical protein
MLQIGNVLVSLDIITRHFQCDLAKCKGMCCVYGVSGAPLERKEAGLISKKYSKIKPYLTEEGKRVIQETGTHIYDEDGDLVTPLIRDKEDCAYAINKAGIILCGIELAFLDGKIGFQKPVSCHLYPVRIRKFRDYVGVNYDTWDICESALIKGDETQLLIYQFLKTPLIRRFGEEWYDELDKVAREYNKSHSK